MIVLELKSALDMIGMVVAVLLPILILSREIIPFTKLDRARLKKGLDVLIVPVALIFILDIFAIMLL
jgi:hypothetical protein